MSVDSLLLLIQILKDMTKIRLKNECVFEKQDQSMAFKDFQGYVGKIGQKPQNPELLGHFKDYRDVFWPTECTCDSDLEYT